MVNINEKTQTHAQIYFAAKSQIILPNGEPPL